MTQFLVLIFSFFSGLLCQKVENFPRQTGQGINLFIIYVSLPALVLTKVPLMIETLDLRGQWWIPVSMMWLSFFLALLFIFILGKQLHWPATRIGALMLTVGLGNTSFVGFPILKAIIGEEAIPIGILADQGGSFLLVSTLGIVVASVFSGRNVNYSIIAKRLFTFPPFLAILLSIIWYLLGNIAANIIIPALDPIAAALVPLALFAVGFQTRINLEVLKRRKQGIAIGLALKLFVIPIICWALYWKALGLNGFYAKVSILEAAMATQITSGVVATEYGLDSEIAQLMVTLSVPLSLLTVPLWNTFLS